jgi:SAM-dependent methyltransferase
MLKVAREKVTHASVSFERIAMEDARFPEGSFDVVLSSLALHYVADYAALDRKVHDWLAPGGSFVFSVEHPVYTAQGSQDWCYSADGEIRHFPVDHYFSEGPRRTVFLGEPVVKYHRTLTTCLGALMDAGFLLRKVVEPTPPEDMRSEPGMMDELRRPMMLLVSAVKPVSDKA